MNTQEIINLINLIFDDITEQERLEILREWLLMQEVN